MTKAPLHLRSLVAASLLGTLTFTAGVSGAADPAAKPAAPVKPAEVKPPAAPAKAAPPAASPAATKGDPSGTWTWSFTTPDGRTIERTIKLAVKGEALTGSTTGRDGTETPIQDGSFKNGQLSWTSVRERDGQKMTSKVQAKLEGDALKGTMSFNRDGSEQTRPFEAKRVK